MDQSERQRFALRFANLRPEMVKVAALLDHEDILRASTQDRYVAIVHFGPSAEPSPDGVSREDIAELLSFSGSLSHSIEVGGFSIGLDEHSALARIQRPNFSEQTPEGAIFPQVRGMHRRRLRADGRIARGSHHAHQPGSASLQGDQRGTADLLEATCRGLGGTSQACRRLEADHGRR